MEARDFRARAGARFILDGAAVLGYATRDMSGDQGRPGAPADARTRQLENELEQLRVALEDAREEVAALASERDVQAAILRGRAAATDAGRASPRHTEEPCTAGGGGGSRRLTAADVEAEKLRVAMEEAQMMAEELESSNAALRRRNDDLDARMARRTLALAEANVALRAAEERTRLILDSATDQAILTLDADGRVTSWNSGAEAVLGWRRDEVIGASVAMIYAPEDSATGVAAELLRRAAAEGRAMTAGWHQRRDGARFWAECEIMPLRGGGGDGALAETPRMVPAGAAPGFLKILRDRGEQRRMEQALREALDDRDLLMREVHHRVKNSLQLVQGLLGAQARAAEPGGSAAVQLAESAARVRTIAAMHDRLYRADPGRLAVELRPYLDGLIEDLRSGMASTLHGRDVRLVVDGEAAWPAAAVPALGLVATELVTNALKYGRGTVLVRFAPAVGDIPATLTVEDEGNGLPEDFDPVASRGLGMRLVMGLLRGEGAGLEVDRASPHTRFVARLPNPRENGRGDAPE